MLREMNNVNEISKLRECLEALAEHHNSVSLYHKGVYPIDPHDKVLEDLKKDISSGFSKIAVIEEDGKIVGFSKIDLDPKCGYLAYLVILKEYRGKGFGKSLLDWAMNSFRSAGIKAVELKVIAGNEAVHLYEKYGFKPRAQIMRYTDDT